MVEATQKTTQSSSSGNNSLSKELTVEKEEESRWNIRSNNQTKRKEISGLTPRSAKKPCSKRQSAATPKGQDSNILSKHMPETQNQNSQRPQSTRNSKPQGGKFTFADDKAKSSQGSEKGRNILGKNRSKENKSVLDLLKNIAKGARLVPQLKSKPNQEAAELKDEKSQTDHFTESIQQIKQLLEQVAKSMSQPYLGANDFSLKGQTSSTQGSFISIAVFTKEVILVINQWGLSQFEAGILEYILSQPPIRDSFKKADKTNNDKKISADFNSLIDTVVGMFNQPTNKDSSQAKEVMMRFLSHLCFCKVDLIGNEQLDKIIHRAKMYIVIPQKISPNTHTQTAQKQIDQAQEQSKLTKAALNCITNIYNKDLPSSSSPQQQSSNNQQLIQSSQQQQSQQACIKENSEQVFRKLKDLFLHLTKSLQFTYKSKRHIIMLTTLVRALQHVMQVAIGSKQMRLLEDSDAIILFVNFYKLAFLGTKFMGKVLQIRVQSQVKSNSASKRTSSRAKTHEKSTSSRTDGQKVSEEVKVDDDDNKSSQIQNSIVIPISNPNDQNVNADKIEIDISSVSDRLSADSSSLQFFIDTSEISSSDNNQSILNHAEMGIEQSKEEDNYFKIKLHAIQSMQILFTANNKAFNLNTLWHPIFPSFLLNNNSELITDKKVLDFGSDQEYREKFQAKAFEDISREPTLLYLIRSTVSSSDLPSHTGPSNFTAINKQTHNTMPSPSSDKLKLAAISAITQLIENSETISKWQGVLERPSTSDSGVQIDVLAQFLRLFHYLLISLIETESDHQMLLAELKLSAVMLKVTPYARMIPGLPTTLMQAVFKQLISDKSQMAKHAQRSPNLTNAALVVLANFFSIEQQGQNLGEGEGEELKCEDADQIISLLLSKNLLLNNAQCCSAQADYSSSESHTHLFESAFRVLTQIAKNGKGKVELLAEKYWTNLPDQNTAATSASLFQTFSQMLTLLTSASHLPHPVQTSAQSSAAVATCGVVVSTQMQLQQQSISIHSLSSYQNLMGPPNLITDQRKLISLCRFLKEWVQQFSKQGDSSHKFMFCEDEQEILDGQLGKGKDGRVVGSANGNGVQCLGLDKGCVQDTATATACQQTPFDIPNFTYLLSTLFASYMHPSFSMELHVALMDILTCIEMEEHWYKIFPKSISSQSSTYLTTEQLIRYLVTLQPLQSKVKNFGQQIQVQVPPILRGQQVQTCAQLLLRPYLSKSEILFEETFNLVLENIHGTSMILQVRNSQATKELCQTLLANKNRQQQEQKLDKIIKLLGVVLTYANSPRDKVLANALRALGFFLASVDIDMIVTAIQGSSQLFSWEVQPDIRQKQVGSPSRFAMTINKILLTNLKKTSPKVVWNACIAIGKINSNPSLIKCQDSNIGRDLFYNLETVQLLFDIISRRPNIKARIQAINSLLEYQGLDQIGGVKILSTAWDTIIECFTYKSHFTGSNAELNYLDLFEKSFLSLWLKIVNFSKDAQTSPEFQNYLNSNSTFRLLQVITDYLRKELQVPQYSNMYASQKEFDEDTERIFQQSRDGQLATKITIIRQGLTGLMQIIENQQNIKVSFSVFEGIQQLVQSEIRQYRGLRVLKEIKSSFIPSFENTNTNPSQLKINQ